MSSVKFKIGEKSRDDVLEVIKGNLDGFFRDVKMYFILVLYFKKLGFFLEEKFLVFCDISLFG